MWLMVLAAAALAGCQGGLSVREGTHDLPLMLYELKGPDEPAAAFRPAGPIRVAVAQVGEIAPEKGLLDGLRPAKDEFERVIGIPLPALAESPYGRVENVEQRRTKAREAVSRAMQLARGLGATHALIVGGYIDTSRRYTWASAFNVLILPLWLAPSVEVRASGKAAAALVDVASGEVVMVSTAQVTDDGVVPLAYASNKEDVLTGKLRGLLAVEVAKQVAADVKAAGGR